MNIELPFFEDDYYKDYWGIGSKLMPKPFSLYAPDEDSKLSSFLSKSFVESQAEPKKNFFLYHYTNFNGLKGILTSRSLWLSDINFMNDSSEVEYGYNLLLAVLNEYRSKLIGTSNKKFVSVSKDVLNNMFAAFSQDFMEPEFDGPMSPIFYITSLCRNPDLLSQWRGYTNSNDGYAIAFSAADLVNQKEKPYRQTTLQLYKVIYTKIVQTKILTEVIDTLWHNFYHHALLLNNTDEAGHFDNIRDTPYQLNIRWVLYEVISIMKHPAFIEEDEYRLVYSCMNTNSQYETQVRAGANFPIPYTIADYSPSETESQNPFTFRLSDREFPVVGIISGPSLHQRQKCIAARLLLAGNLIPPQTAVYASKTPLR